MNSGYLHCFLLGYSKYSMFNLIRIEIENMYSLISYYNILLTQIIYNI